jgi:hypothetical protein
MKTKSFFIAALLIGASASYAQQVEIDDMYFTSKDRASLNATKPAPTINNNEDEDAVQTKKNSINPTDSYSGRGTNPEYTSKNSVNSTVSKSNPTYFSNNYQPKSVNQNLAYQPTGLNNLYNYQGYNNYGYNGFNNYGMNSFYGNGFNNFYSPYSAYGMGMGFSPYSSFGISSLFGWGGYGSFGNGFGSPYSSFYGNNFFGGGYNPFGYGFGSGYYPSTVIIVNNNNDVNSGYVRGRRVERGGGDSYYDGNRSRGTVAANGNSGSNGGRVSASNQYYDRSWRNNVPQESQGQSRSYFNNSSNSGYSGNTRSSWDGGNNQSSFGNSRSSFGDNNSGFSGGGGARSSGFSGGGGGNAGGGSSSGGGGGGRSRN